MNEQCWISIEEALPKEHEWVLVFEDDNDNPHDRFISKMFNHPLQRIKPAMLLFIDNQGYPNWYLCYIGGSPAGNYRNVTHWMPMPVNFPESALLRDKQLNETY